MADAANKYPENVAGKYYVDNQCIDCDLCRETAPDNFKRNDDGGYSVVYKQAGTPDQIQVMRIMVQDPTSKAWSVSETQAITTHTTPNGPAKAAHDAAWDTFVAMFADSSTIKSTYLACMASM